MKLELKRKFLENRMYMKRVTYKDLAIALGLGTTQAAKRMAENGSPKYAEELAEILGIKDPKQLVKIVIKKNGGETG